MFCCYDRNRDDTYDSVEWLCGPFWEHSRCSIWPRPLAVTSPWRSRACWSSDDARCTECEDQCKRCGMWCFCPRSTGLGRSSTAGKTHWLLPPHQPNNKTGHESKTNGDIHYCFLTPVSWIWKKTEFQFAIFFIIYFLISFSLSYFRQIFFQMAMPLSIYIYIDRERIKSVTCFDLK